MLVLLNSPSHDVLKADAKVRFIFIIYKSKSAIVRFFCSEIDVDVHFFILFFLNKRLIVAWNVFTLLGYNVIDGFVKAVRELCEVLAIEEYLVLLERNRCVFALSRNQFLAFGYRNVHLLSTVLFYINVVNTFTGLDCL